MKSKVRFNLRNQTDDESMLYLVVRKPGTRLVISTGIKLRPQQWDNMGQVVILHTHFKQVNSLLEGLSTVADAGYDGWETGVVDTKKYRASIVSVLYTERQILTYRKRKMYYPEFDEWRERAGKGLPKIAERVFALRGTGYMGCGFHWSMEKSLGYCINRLNDFDNPVNDIGSQIALQVVYEGLIKDLVRIEGEIGKNPAE